MEISAQTRAQAQDLLAFIDASPSPWHAVETIAERLRKSGFVALRTHLPMDLCRDQALVEVPADAQADIQRICALWVDCRARFGQEGEFLFGHASIADAFYAPVASRLRSYRIELPAVAAAYVETIYQWPPFQRWLQAAREEVQA